jgi:hypothetical protein
LKEDHVEYDLDNEDEDWLATYNARACSATSLVNGASLVNHQQGLGAAASALLSSPSYLLTDSKFEKLLWKLEVACALANEKNVTTAGVG